MVYCTVYGRIRQGRSVIFIITACVLLCLCQPISAQQSNNKLTDDAKVTVFDDDPRTTAILRDPFGLPTTGYEQWRANKGTPAPFSSQRIASATATDGGRDGEFMAVLVNETLYPSIEADITRYIQDVTDDGFTVVLYTISGGTCFSMRSFLMARYAEGMTGALFVGDLPVAWFEATCFDDPVIAQFPCDLYYMDLDGFWEDLDMNDINDQHNGDVSPEIWIGRLTASTLTYGGADEVSLLHRYFEKNHAFRISGSQFADRMLAYIDDDWARSGYQDQLTNAYTDLTTVNDLMETFCPDYLNRCREDYESVLTCVHSSPWAHGFHRPGDVMCGVWSEDIVNTDPKGCFYNLFACSNSRFVETDYMGGWYLFSENGCLIVLGSTKTGSMLNFRQYYNPLSEGKCHGQAFEDWFCAMGDDGFAQTEMCWYYGMTLQGDPTLCLQPPRPHIIDCSPAVNHCSVPLTNEITLEFDRDLDPASIDDSDIRVYGSYTGEYPGVVTFDAATDILSFDAAIPLKPGENIFVHADDSKIATTGTELYEGMAWSFTVAADGCAEDYTYVIDTVEAIGLAPTALTAVDFDGDTDIDLVAALTDDDAIAVILNDGTGHFSAPTVYPAGDAPRALATADLNSDGAVDIVSVNAADNTVAIHISADKALGLPVFYTVGDEPTSVCVADLNRDGAPDIIAANWSGQSISVLLNNGDGSDFTVTDYFCGSAPVQVLPVDANHDYVPDVAVLSYNNRISLLINNGDGTFPYPAMTTLSSSPVSMTLPDFDGDGRLDLAYARSSIYGITVLTMDEYTTYTITDDAALTAKPTVLRGGDIDGDGDLDFVIASETGGTLSIIRDEGDSPLAAPLVFEAGCHPTDMVLADLNGDAVLDIAAVDSSTGNLTVLTQYVYLCGNANGDDQVNVGDVVFLINYAFKDGPEPFPADAADANDDDEINIGDAVFLINYTFKDGPGPICRAW